ncbi:MAG: cytidine deaminase [Pseudomonadota bacterium]
MEELIAAAQAVRARAYAPYSRHAVGAALRDDKGRVHLGVNVENAASPQGQCAEASAIGAMVTAGGTCIAEIAIVGPGPHLCTPCGGCRQRLREFAGDDLPIFIGDPDGLQEQFTLGALLPASFGPENVG